MLARRLISSWFITQVYLRLEHEVLDCQNDSLGVDCELFLVRGHKGVKSFKTLSLGDVVALSQRLDEELVVGRVEIVRK